MGEGGGCETIAIEILEIIKNNLIYINRNRDYQFVLDNIQPYIKITYLPKNNIEIFRPDGSIDSYECVLKNASFQCFPDLFYCDDIKEKLILYLKTKSPIFKEFKPLRLNYFSISIFITIESFVDSLIKVFSRFSNYCLFGFAYYTKKFVDFIENKNFEIKKCKILYLDNRMLDNIKMEENFHLIKMENYKFMNDEIFNLFHSQRKGFNTLTFDPQFLYVIEYTDFEKKIDFSNNSFDIDNLFFKEKINNEFLIKKKIINVIWALFLSNNFVVKELGDFVSIQSFTHDISLFVNGFYKKYLSNKDKYFDKETTVKIYKLLIDYDDEKWNKIYIVIDRLLKVINADNDIDKAIDLRVSLEILLDIVNDKKTDTFAKRINYLCEEYDYKKAKKLYKVYSQAIHFAKFEKNINSSDYIDKGLMLSKKIIVHYIENNIFYLNDEWMNILKSRTY